MFSKLNKQQQHKRRASSRNTFSLKKYLSNFYTLLSPSSQREGWDEAKKKDQRVRPPPRSLCGLASNTGLILRFLYESSVILCEFYLISL